MDLFELIIQTLIGYLIKFLLVYNLEYVLLNLN